MKLLVSILRLLDSIISISMLLVGCWMFFVKSEFIIGSIVLGMHSLYSSNAMFGRVVYMLENLDFKIK